MNFEKVKNKGGAFMRKDLNLLKTSIIQSHLHEIQILIFVQPFWTSSTLNPSSLP